MPVIETSKIRDTVMCDCMANTSRLERDECEDTLHLASASSTSVHWQYIRRDIEQQADFPCGFRLCNFQEVATTSTDTTVLLSIVLLVTRYAYSSTGTIVDGYHGTGTRVPVPGC